MALGPLRPIGLANIVVKRARMVLPALAPRTIQRAASKFSTWAAYKDEEIIKKIEEILQKDEKELELPGNKAREFVIENKSAVKQVGRINKFLKNNI